MTNLALIEPLLEAKLQQFRNNHDSSEFYFYVIRNPIMDFRGGRPYFDLRREFLIYHGLTPAEADVYGANYVMRSISPHIYENARTIKSRLVCSWKLGC
ncbi:hypothetical protein AZF37_01065 [endosymbiont 'TC1' of Trimyema compressum]|uniref:hypothetical protein n=1 Tax=endosymbiont 'TC1' of Trimyema compressum TaxID=243899 RepID=UPI0007F0B217|nr:hypothetical protein [endosymbiont 'TC1' of Trimyema compressum]AMP19959.1 hypothetical protein AZF37_01065 [endosymbiont 'TC1' of Trimyema compressum]